MKSKQKRKSELKKGYKVVAYCKVCKRGRMIINGLCPGCLRKGSIVFDPDFDVLKDMGIKP